jgi:hypothetical protein
VVFGAVVDDCLPVEECLLGALEEILNGSEVTLAMKTSRMFFRKSLMISALSCSWLRTL